jgi:hypothetical protein
MSNLFWHCYLLKLCYVVYLILVTEYIITLLTVIFHTTRFYKVNFHRASIELKLGWLVCLSLVHEIVAVYTFQHVGLANGKWC